MGDVACDFNVQLSKDYTRCWFSCHTYSGSPRIFSLISVNLRSAACQHSAYDNHARDTSGKKLHNNVISAGVGFTIKTGRSK